MVGSGGFVRVNSRHSNGIREAQKSSWLLASAYSLEDGIIEALESSRHRWVIGVQFRPERRMEVPPHFDRLFQSLLERARGAHGCRQVLTLEPSIPCYNKFNYAIKVRLGMGRNIMPPDHFNVRCFRTGLMRL